MLDTHKETQESQDESLFDPTGHNHILPQEVGVFMQLEGQHKGPAVPIVVCQNCRALMEKVIHGRIDSIKVSTGELNQAILKEYRLLQESLGVATPNTAEFIKWLANHPIHDKIFGLIDEYKDSVDCGTSWMERVDGYTKGKTNVVFVEQVDLTKRSNIFERWERAGSERDRFSEKLDIAQDIDERFRLLTEVRRANGVRTFLRTLMGGDSPMVLGDEGFQAKYRLKT